MIARAVVVPMTPLLFRSESGLADPVAELREAAVEAVRDLAAAEVQRIVALCPVGVDGAPADYRRPSGAPGAGPLSLQVADELARLAGVEAPVEAVLVDGTTDTAARVREAEGSEVVGLLVLGEGAARRSQGAPGHIDERSFAFDDALAAALADGDGAALAGLDQALAEELMVTGRQTFAALGRLLPSPDRAELRYRADPFGTSYFVAVWG